MRITTWILAGVAAALAVAASAQEVAEPAPSPVAQHMHEDLGQLNEIKAALVAGNLGGVKEPALVLASHERAEEARPEWEPFYQTMRDAAKAASTATTLGAAGNVVAGIAVACGNCHVANAISIEFGYEQKPALDLDDLVSHMQRHQWAVDRMWEGMFGPSDIAWNRGTDMLIDIAIHAEDVPVDSGTAAKVRDLDRRIHSLGGKGTQTKTAQSRQALYSEVVALCGDCHRMLNLGPGQ